MIAEEASFNAKPMIEEATFFIAERRGFTPGAELSDWLQAEAETENLLRSPDIERRKSALNDQRDKASSAEIFTAESRIGSEPDEINEANISVC